MRSSNGWHLALSRELTDVWPQDLGGFPPAAMLAVELGLYLLGRVMPGRPARDAWTLFGWLPVRGGVRPCPDGRAAPGDPPGPTLPVDNAPPPRLAHAPGAVPYLAPGVAWLPASRP